MRIIKIDPCAELRKTPSGTHEIGVCDHASAFYVFDTCDVWTQDGWLITAIQDDGIHHLRKGCERALAEMDGTEVLRYIPTPKSLHYTSTYLSK
jgi:hypothetical protein